MGKQDSILHIKTDSLAQRDTLERASLFSGHSLKIIHPTPMFNGAKTSYWPGILLFLTLSIYVLIRISEPKKILRIFVSVFSIQEAKQLFREEFKLTKRMSLLLGIGFILVMAFLIQKTNEYFGLILLNAPLLKQYMFFVGIIVVMYLIKFVANSILAYIISDNDLGKEYLYTVFVFGQTIGIILFPFIVCLQYTTYPSEWFLYPALVICAGFYALRMFRVFVLSTTEQNIGILYIFLYLCALEILPLLVLIKFLLVNF